MDNKTLLILLAILGVGASKLVVIDEYYENNYELHVCGRRLAMTLRMACEDNVVDAEELLEGKRLLTKMYQIKYRGQLFLKYNFLRQG